MKLTYNWVLGKRQDFFLHPSRSLFWFLFTLCVLFFCFFAVYNSRFEIYRELRFYELHGLEIYTGSGLALLGIWRLGMGIFRTSVAFRYKFWYQRLRQAVDATVFNTKAIPCVVYTAYGKKDAEIYNAIWCLAKSMYEYNSKKMKIVCAMNPGQRGGIEGRIIAAVMRDLIKRSTSEAEREFYKRFDEAIVYFKQKEQGGKRLAIVKCIEEGKKLPGKKIYVLMDGDTCLHADTMTKSIPMMQYMSPKYGGLTINIKADMQSNGFFALYTDARNVDRNADCMFEVSVMTGRFALLDGAVAEDEAFMQLLLKHDVVFQGIAGRAIFRLLDICESLSPLWAKKSVQAFARKIKAWLISHGMGPVNLRMISGDDKSVFYWLTLLGKKVLYLPDVFATCMEEPLNLNTSTKEVLEKFHMSYLTKSVFVRELSSFFRQPFRYSRNMMSVILSLLSLGRETNKTQNLGNVRIEHPVGPMLYLKLMDQRLSFATPLAAPLIASYYSFDVHWALFPAWLGASYMFRIIKTRLKGLLMPKDDYNWARPTIDFLGIPLAGVKTLVYTAPYGGWQRGVVSKVIRYIPYKKLTLTLSGFGLFLYMLSQIRLF